MPLFKCSSGKATPKKVIAYITDKNKAELVSVRNLFEDEDYARQFTDTQNLFGKGKKFDERKYYHIKLFFTIINVKESPIAIQIISISALTSRAKPVSIYPSTISMTPLISGTPGIRNRTLVASAMSEVVSNINAVEAQSDAIKADTTKIM